MMTDHVQVTGRPKRSPSYPALDLGTALQRAEELYRAERQNAVPVEVAVKHWGYKSPNGRSNSVVSALKKYGLIVDSGTGRARKIQVTDATRRILEHPSSSERLVMVQKAALLPRIHNEMWLKYGAHNMPSDRTWAWGLKEELEFTDVGAVDFIKEYRETIKFAQLGDDEAEDPEVNEGVDEYDADDEMLTDGPGRSGYQFPDAMAQQLTQAQRELVQREAALAAPPGMQSVNIPLPGGGTIILQGVFPIPEAHWTYLEAVLTAMKPGLVKEASTPIEQVE